MFKEGCNTRRMIAGTLGTMRITVCAHRRCTRASAKRHLDYYAPTTHNENALDRKLQPQNNTICKQTKPNTKRAGRVYMAVLEKVNP